MKRKFAAFFSRKGLLCYALLALSLMLSPSCKDMEEHYGGILDELGATQYDLKRSYKSAVSERERDYIEREAHQHIFETIEQVLFEEWYGTSWDFNGTTEIPNTGKVACGYFVSTVLRDAGFPIERRRLAQQSSENIIKTLVDDEDISRYSDIEIDAFEQDVIQHGDGFYILGLDTHVGFLRVIDGKAFIIHSSYSYWGGVKKEPLSKSDVVIKSRYRVIGKISSNKQLLQKWLNDKLLKTVTKSKK